MKKALLILTILLFLISLLKNISFPLLWNDESETAMQAERILAFGYPKIHDGKNLIYHFPCPAGAHKGTDANVICGWTQYYFAAIGVALAKLTGDIYLKTMLVRIPFALIGFAGILLIALGALDPQKKEEDKTLFLLLFFIFELFSVPLMLHLKEARYYSLVVFTFSLIFLLYFNYVFFKKISFLFYCCGIIFSSFLLFNTYYPAFIIFIVTAGLWEFCTLVLAIAKNKSTTKKALSAFLVNLSPLLAGSLSVIPLIFFYKILEISSFYHSIKPLSPKLYFDNLYLIWCFFKGCDFIYLAIFIKLFLLVTIIGHIKNKSPLPSMKKIAVSGFLTFFFFVYWIVIAASPYFFERYFIVLQPVLTAIILLDGFWLWERLKNQNQKKIFELAAIAIFVVSALNLAPLVSDHLYEITHQYKGPLDFAIPYIKDKYQATEKLIIATNYEETSYMYYLGSKTIIGSAGNNIKNDLKGKPDIIILRKSWPGEQVLATFLRKKHYTKKIFPILDYPFNNIPDMRFHLFKTEFATNESESLFIFSADKP